MDAIALAQSLDEARDFQGRISLSELRRQLQRRGLDELARAVDTLAGRLTPGREDNNPPAPWI